MHWSFWIFGVCSLIWNVMGLANFAMQMNASFVASMPSPLPDFIAARPIWATAAFALAVIAGVIGSVLLLLRKSLALLFFWLSLIGTAVSLLHVAKAFASEPMLQSALIGNTISLAVVIFYVWYTRTLCVLYDPLCSRRSLQKNT